MALVHATVKFLLFIWAPMVFHGRLVASDAVNGTCDPGWLQFRDKCISFSSKMNYENALKYCQNIKSSLMEIDSVEKESFVASSVPDSSNVYWLGLIDLVGNDSINDHVWVQSNRSVIATGYQNWGLSNPGKASQRCVVLRNSPPYQWYDRSCDDTYYAICEKNSVKDIVASSTVGYPMSSTAGRNFV
ncbi:uncharacterized protein TRIADDRAFT_61845 [Trichoplax adhaerens]|uniref:C-type lectin domain-containing protein n=1 Tax=Trichoplax adhaerens TaxID=10228 RepID=B3SC55_TRIAD|nr:hypothetical protein TRIADDRAFT_61845 [Trichoplax adhaerens]EDV19658.1 hypothetical protein TRIADDRAFT_61845 [Trichoplax adhaerens]|eukprot:XP_002117815.1 hypothetical protein TRIADDRAFT_61845 [Trichoplax adhaerens]